MQFNSGWIVGGAVVVMLSASTATVASGAVGAGTAGEAVAVAPPAVRPAVNTSEAATADQRGRSSPAATTATAPRPARAPDPPSFGPAPPWSTERVHPRLAPTMALPDPATAPELAEGDTDQAVEVLEWRLAELGYRPGPLDDSFGGATASAVLAFQKAENLDRVGWVDTATWARLGAPQAWRPSGSDRYPRVEIDLSRQVAIVIFGPEHVVTLNTSTGGGYDYRDEYGNWWVAHTPTGTYNVYAAYDSWVEAPLGSLYRPMYYDGGYAIHGSPSVPAYPASHGCVRLANDDMDWLFELAPEELEVSVFDTMDPSAFPTTAGHADSLPSPAVVPA